MKRQTLPETFTPFEAYSMMREARESIRESKCAIFDSADELAEQYIDAVNTYNGLCGHAGILESVGDYKEASRIMMHANELKHAIDELRVYVELFDQKERMATEQGKDMPLGMRIRNDGWFRGTVEFLGNPEPTPAIHDCIEIMLTKYEPDN